MRVLCGPHELAADARTPCGPKSTGVPSRERYLIWKSTVPVYRNCPSIPCFVHDGSDAEFPRTQPQELTR